MWTETNQTLQEIHKFVSEKPQDASREEKGTTEVHSDDQTVARSEERKETAKENEEKDLNVNEEVVPAVPPVVNGIVTEDSEYVGKGAMSYR